DQLAEALVQNRNPAEANQVYELVRRNRAEIVQAQAASISKTPGPPVIKSERAYRILYAAFNQDNARRALDERRKQYRLQPSPLTAGRVAQDCLDLAVLLDPKRDSTELRELLKEAGNRYEEWKVKGGLIKEEETLIGVLRKVQK